MQTPTDRPIQTHTDRHTETDKHIGRHRDAYRQTDGDTYGGQTGIDIDRHIDK